MLEKLYCIFYALSLSLKKLLSIVRVHEIYLLCLTLLMAGPDFQISDLAQVVDIVRVNKQGTASELSTSYFYLLLFC
jgi:hypothetical protein